MGMCLARQLTANKKKKEAPLPKALRLRLQSLLVEENLFEKERNELWKPEGAAKRPHSKAGWNRSSLAKQWCPNPAEVRRISRDEWA